MPMPMPSAFPSGCRVSQDSATMKENGTTKRGWRSTHYLETNVHDNGTPRFIFLLCSSVPGLRTSSLASTKYKASFLMLKMSGMGDPQLRARLHMRRVHKWAGDLFPDDCETSLCVGTCFMWESRVGLTVCTVGWGALMKSLVEATMSSSSRWLENALASLRFSSLFFSGFLCSLMTLQQLYPVSAASLLTPAMCFFPPKTG